MTGRVAAGLLAALAVPARAAGPESLSGGAALSFDRFPSVVAGRIEGAQEMVGDRQTFIDVNSCWTRQESPEADGLELPRKVCVRRAGVSIPKPFRLPFVEGSAMLIEGDPVSGRLHVGGGAREERGWNIVGSTDIKRRKPKCGKLNKSFLAFYMDIDAEGQARPGPMQVRGFLMDQAVTCRNQARSVQIDFVPLP